jgi:hypothetical protein
METRDIGWAVRLLKDGKRVTRAGWNGKGQYLELHTSDEPLKEGECWKQGREGMSLPYVYIKTVQGDTVPWLCSQTDLLATDYEEVEG